MFGFVVHLGGVVRDLSQQICDLIAGDHTLSRVRIHVEGTLMRCTCGQTPSKRFLLSLVQVDEMPIAVRAALQSFVGVAEQFQPSSILVHVCPIFLDIVGDAIRFPPEVPSGIIKITIVFYDPVHGLHQFRAKEHFRTLSGS